MEDPNAELQVTKKKVTDLERQLQLAINEVDTLRLQNSQLEERAASAELQLESLSGNYRRSLEAKESDIRELQNQVHSEDTAGLPQSHCPPSPGANDLETNQLNNQIKYLKAEVQHWKNVVKTQYQQPGTEDTGKNYSRTKARLAELEKERDKWEKEGRREDLNLTTRVDFMVDFRQEEERAQEEINGLKAEIRKVERERERVRETSAVVGRQYREMCTLLTGYQCKMKEQGDLYQVQSIYAQGSENSFLFKKAGDSVQLLESDYTPEWAGFVEMYLETDGCIPAFLAAVTLQLYDKHQEDTRSEPLQQPESGIAESTSDP